MKISIVIFCTCALSAAKRTHSSVIHSHRHSSWEVDQIDEVLTPEEIRELQYWDEKYFHRSKRSGDYGSSGSGSSDIVAAIAKALANGIKKKVKAVANGSAGALAGASAGFSKGSSGGDSPKYHTTSYGEHPHPTGYEHVDSGTEHKYDPWELKSSIFNTLLQALKAIKGGVLAIKGQLIKGSGFIVSGAGKVIAASGDKVTSLGKNVISKAVLVKPDKHPEYGPPTSYGPPSAPPSAYGVPPPSYSGPSSYAAAYTDHHSHNDVKLPLPPGSQAGILILKKIQSDHRKEASYNVPSFKPLSPASPSYGTVINKILSASVKPSSFGNTGNSPTSYDFPVAPHYEEPRNNYQISTEPIIAAPTASDYNLPISSQGLTAPQPDLNFPTAPASTSFGGELKPPPTTYGVPFEHQEPFPNDYLSAEGSQKDFQTVRAEKLTKGEVLEKLESIKPTKSTFSNIVKSPYSSGFLNGANSKEINTSASSNYLKNTLYPELSEFMDVAHSNDFVRPSSSVIRDIKFEKPFSAIKMPSSYKPSKYPRLEDYPGYLENISDEKIFKKISSYKMKTLPNHPPPYFMRSEKTSSSSSDLRHRRPSLDMVRSVSFEITPDGPQRLT